MTTDLLEIVKRFENVSIAILGDLMLDRYIWGKVSRVSPEAPVVVVHVTEETSRIGGAGNVAHNISSLGARALVCGVIGDDEGGRTLIELMNKVGINTDGVVVDRGRPTTVKSRVIAHSQQVVRVDREKVHKLESAFTEGIAAAFSGQLEKCGGAVISDYGKGVISEALLTRVFDESGVKKIGLGGNKCAVLVDPKSPNYGLYRGATVMKPNRGEAEEASGMSITDRESAAQAGKVLLEKWQCNIILITLGSEGMVLVSKVDEKNPVAFVDTVARQVYDVSGAGDTVSAVFALSLAAGATPLQAAQIANHAAGIVVGEVGTVAVDKRKLLEVLSH